jgi:hypothetical protein
MSPCETDGSGGFHGIQGFDATFHSLFGLRGYEARLLLIFVPFVATGLTRSNESKRTRMGRGMRQNAILLGRRSMSRTLDPLAPHANSSPDPCGRSNQNQPVAVELKPDSPPISSTQINLCFLCCLLFRIPFASFCKKLS